MQHDSGAKDRGSKGSVEHEPVDQHGHNRDGCRAGLDTECGDGPRTEGENRGEEQKYDAKHVHRAIPGITVIFDVIRKLPPEIRVHAALAAALAYGNASEPVLTKVRHSRFIT